MDRKAGVLLNISSLPGPYGIGSLSQDAERFADEIASMGFRVWQTLPVTASGKGNSPYSGASGFAGNYLYIDPSRLFGLLTKEEIESCNYNGIVYLTDYDFAKAKKREALKTAYSRIGEDIKAGIVEFRVENDYWLDDYAGFMTAGELNGFLPWYEWKEPYRAYSPALIRRLENENPDLFNYYIFEQFAFFTQWRELKKYVNESGIEILGDLPIYVSRDSADVWAHTKQFLLDGDFNPTMVAGVPPDYFAAEGQLWGNPLYDYETMRKNGYRWWIKRLLHALELYDILRIDHFRSFYEFWAVDSDAKSAKCGRWMKGPGTAIFDALKRIKPKHNIIAEDLGQIDEKVLKFVEKTGYPGMRVMQFGFDGDPNNRHLPHNYIPDCVAYTGTHDNDTTLGWLLSCDENTRNAVFNYTDCDGGYGWASGAGQCRATRAFMRCLIQSCAVLAIIPMQDLCGYGSDTRMNVPGMLGDCWRYRTNYTAINSVDRDFIRNIITTYGR